MAAPARVHADEWQRRIKGAQLQLQPGGRMPIDESPEEVAGTMLGFLG